MAAYNYHYRIAGHWRGGLTCARTEMNDIPPCCGSLRNGHTQEPEIARGRRELERSGPGDDKPPLGQSDDRCHRERRRSAIFRVEEECERASGIGCDLSRAA